MKVKRIIDRTISYSFFFITLMIVLFPVGWILITSLKTEVQMFAIPPVLIPKPTTFLHYRDVIFNSPFVRQLINSFITSFVSTCLSLIFGIPAAYGFARFSTRSAHRIIFYLITAVRMVPQIVMVIPFFLIVSMLGLSDTRFALITVYLPFQMTLVIWILKNFFQTVPHEIEEAAEIDGLSVFQRLIKIIIPLCTSSIGVSAMLAFLFSWNEFMFALSLTSRQAQTLTVGIAGYVTSFQTFWGKMSASAIMFMLPAIVLTLLFQKGMVKGLTAGAVKG